MLARGRPAGLLAPGLALLREQLLAGEQLDDAGVVEVLDGSGPHDPAVPEHRDLVGDPEDLAEVMGDVQHSDAGRGHGAHPVEQIVHLVHRKRRRRLVEHEQTRRVLRIFSQSAGDGHAGALGRAERGHERLRVDVEAEPLQVVLGLLVSRLSVDRSERRGKAGPERHVVQDGQRRDEPEVLLHEPASEPVGLHR